MLLLADANYAGVVETSAGVTSDSDVAVEMLHIKAAAQISLGQDAGAMETFRDALVGTAGRDPALRRIAGLRGVGQWLLAAILIALAESPAAGPKPGTRTCFVEMVEG